LNRARNCAGSRFLTSEGWLNAYALDIGYIQIVEIYWTEYATIQNSIDKVNPIKRSYYVKLEKQGHEYHVYTNYKYCGCPTYGKLAEARKVFLVIACVLIKEEDKQNTENQNEN
jgi:hypothetical protein